MPCCERNARQMQSLKGVRPVLPQCFCERLNGQSSRPRLHLHCTCRCRWEDSWLHSASSGQHGQLNYLWLQCVCPFKPAWKAGILLRCQHILVLLCILLFGDRWRCFLKASDFNSDHLSVSMCRALLHPTCCQNLAEMILHGSFSRGRVLQPYRFLCHGLNPLVLTAFPSGRSFGIHTNLSKSWVHMPIWGIETNFSRKKLPVAKVGVHRCPF